MAYGRLSQLSLAANNVLAFSHGTNVAEFCLGVAGSRQDGIYQLQGSHTGED